MKSFENKASILILGTSDIGGAGEYMFRLANLLIKNGHKVVFLVKRKGRDHEFIIEYDSSVVKSLCVKFYEKFRNKFYKRDRTIDSAFEKKYHFYNIDEEKKNLDVSKVLETIKFKPEFIISGWISGFANTTDLYLMCEFFKAKIYLLTIDMNISTGGRHYAWDCKGYQYGCNYNCPAVLDKKFNYIPERDFKIKYQNITKGKFEVISGSGWTLSQAQKSLLFKNQSKFSNLNSLIDTTVFHSKHRSIAKKLFNLQSNKFYILNGSTFSNEQRKGFDYFLDSLEILNNNLEPKQRDGIEVLIVSKVEQETNIPFKANFIKFIDDQRLLSLLYQAADVFVNSSIEDSGPMMVSEALACGTPVVGFDMGIVNNLVVSNFNGYKAELKNSNDLAMGILTVFNLDKNDYFKVSENAQMQIEKFSSFEYAYNELNKLFK